MTNLEKIARAMQAADGVRNAAKWEDESEGNRWDYMQMAVTALTALRDSCDDLLEAGISAKDRHYAKMEAEGRDTRTVVIADHPAGTIFDAMIDAVLDEKQTEPA